MFNIYYNRDNGRIVAYQEGDTIIADNVLTLDKPQELNGYRVSPRNGKLEWMAQNLIGEDRAEALADVASKCPEGCFVEVGTYKGGSAWYLLNTANKQGRKLHLFDTFTGIPFQDVMDDTMLGDFGDTNVETVKAYLPEAIFHVGLFPDTLTDDVQDIAFVHFDGDQYRSTKAVLTHLWPRMVSGGKIYFDDSCLHGGLAGVNQALTEDFAGMVKEDVNARMNYVVKP